jgi:hypothetical protein
MKPDARIKQFPVPKLSDTLAEVDEDAAREMRGLGRRADVQKMIVDAVRDGVPLTVVAKVLGVSKQSPYNWVRSYPNLRRRVMKLRLERVQGAARNIKSAGEAGEWRADAWWLERSHPDEFGATARVEHGGAVAIGPLIELPATLDDGSPVTPVTPTAIDTPRRGPDIGERERD